MGLSPPSSAYMETRSRELHLGRSRPASSQEVYRRPHFIPERSPDQTPPPHPGRARLWPGHTQGVLRHQSSATGALPFSIFHSFIYSFFKLRVCHFNPGRT